MLSLENLRNSYRSELFDDFVPFMDRYVIDHEHGGFRCNTDRDGTHLSQDKETWFEGRGIWVYSFLYNNFGRNDKFLEVARKSLDLLLRVKSWDDNKMYPKKFSREGKPLTAPDPEVYGDLFVAEGLTELSRATGDEKYWVMARRLVDKCVKAYDDPGYYPEIGRTYFLERSPGPFPGARIQGVWMVLLRTGTQMLRLRPDPGLEDLTRRCVGAVLDYHYNPEFDLNNELLAHDLSRPTGAYSRFVYTGHAIETLWMVCDEALRSKDSATFDRAAGRFRRHFDVAWDDVYKGAFRGLLDVDENLWILDKKLWLQEEILVGSLLIHEKTGASWAWDIFEKTYRYVQEKFPLRQYGFPYWITSADRKVTFERHYDRIENYHRPRHLMLNLLALERMMNQ